MSQLDTWHSSAVKFSECLHDLSGKASPHEDWSDIPTDAKEVLRMAPRFALRGIHWQEFNNFNQVFRDAMGQTIREFRESNPFEHFRRKMFPSRYFFPPRY